MTRVLKSLKDFHFNGLLLSEVFIVWGKKVQRSYLSWHWRVIQNWKKNWLAAWKMTRNFANFHQSTWKCQNWNFDGILLSKVGNVWAQNLQRSYVSWQWRMIQKLKRNWLVVLKLTWGTSQILTRALESLKNLCFNWLLVTKVYIVWAAKVQRSYLSWHWGVMHILKKKWLVVWNRQFGKFSPEQLKVSKLGLWWGPSVQSRKVMTLKFTEELCVMAAKNNAKFEEELTCQFKTDMRNLTNFDSSTLI